MLMSEQFPASKPEKTVREKLSEKFPAPEDWEALQGGKPRVFYKPDSKAAWVVVHVYEQHRDKAKRFQSGAVVPTNPPEELKLLDKYIIRKDFEGNEVRREVLVPSFMDRTVHGDVCEDRSGKRRASNYDRITSQPQYEQYLAQLSESGYLELTFRIGEDSYLLQPQRIAPAKPLEDS